jgi:hypothetical protein
MHETFLGFGRMHENKTFFVFFFKFDFFEVFDLKKKTF